MKKLVYSLAVLFSVALVSCGGNKAAEAVDTDTMVAEEVVVDTENSLTKVNLKMPEIPLESPVFFVGTAPQRYRQL